ncbi:hypothetical protein ACJRO7_022438 [Eucalyptus globulus]|uniref:Uncharacterized protein n=1 Tax=Eucalyptus globulus TaxID=34317 RepID=A0ABD3K0Z5_EUCGL
MARNPQSCLTVTCVLWLLGLLMGSSLLASEARSLSNVAADPVSGDALGNGVAASMIKAPHVKTIEAGGGPSPGGKGHRYPPSVAFKNSGPSSGEGH